jgi:hypothetical protein
MSNYPVELDDKDSKGEGEHIEDNDSLSNGGNPLDRMLAGQAHDLTAEDRMTALAIAQEIDPGPPVMSWRMLCFVGYVLVTCMCSGDNGEASAKSHYLNADVNVPFQDSTERSCLR